MFGNLIRECGVLGTMSDTAQNILANLITLLLGITISFSMRADQFVTKDTLLILVIGLFAFVMDTIGGVLLAKFMNLFLKKKINPMIGGAGTSAFPMSSRVIQKMAMEEDPTNVILMQAAGANVSGQIASVIAGGMVINLAASCDQANTVMAALTIMGKGMAGIFAAILIILLLVWILRKVSR